MKGLNEMDGMMLDDKWEKEMNKWIGGVMEGGLMMEGR
jgi:hypothetical protein